MRPWLSLLMLAHCLSCFISNAQTTTVTGSAPNFVGKEIRLLVQDDPITGTERILDRDTVNERGAFTLQGIVEPVQYAFLQVGRECGDLFLERDKDVTVRFAPPKRPQAPEGFNDRFFFRLDFIAGDGARINRELTRYNSQLDAFLKSVYPLMKLRKDPRALNDSLVVFRNRMELEFDDASPFVAEHIRYSLANVEQTFLFKKQALYDRYLKDRPEQPWNPEYIRFVEQFYEGIFHQTALVSRRTECIGIMKKTAAFAEMEELLMQQTFMERPFLRRMVLISGMEQLYGQQGFEPERISATLRDFAFLSSNSVLANAAKNIADRKDRMRINTPAPDFNLVDTDGHEHLLSDYEGDYLFLEITDATNPYCQQESALISEMQKRFQGIRFLTVTVDNSDEEVADFRLSMAPDRTVVSIKRNHDMVADYAVTSLPTFVIIGPEGRLYRSPALDPSKGGVSELEILNQSISGKLKVGEK